MPRGWKAAATGAPRRADPRKAEIIGPTSPTRKASMTRTVFVSRTNAAIFLGAAARPGGAESAVVGPPDSFEAVRS
jgi:hypothetical protein